MPPDEQAPSGSPPGTLVEEGAIVVPDVFEPRADAQPPTPDLDVPTPPALTAATGHATERGGDASAPVDPPEAGEGSISHDVATPGQPLPHVADPAVRRRLAPWVIVVGSLLLLVAVAIGASFTPLFEARTIRVSGVHHLTRARVLRMAHLSNGTNLLHTDLAAAERRLERDPWISRATVSRRLPGTLDINLTERKPAANINLGSTLELIAGDGTRLGPTVEADGLPLVQTLGSVAPPTGEALRAGATVAEALPVPLRASVATISVGYDNAVLLALRDGLTVIYGDAGQAIAKGEALRAVLGYAAGHGLRMSTIDVTVPEAPTATLANGASVVPAR